MYEDTDEYDYNYDEPGRRYDDPRWPPPPARGGDDGEGYEADRSLLRVAAVIVALAAVIIVLIIPPISILDRGDGATESSEGIVAQSQGSVPDLPEGLEAVSAFYDLDADDTVTGARTLTVRLSRQTEDATNLAFYTHVDDEWQRIAAVQPVDGGRAASGEVPSVPENIAVLRRTAFAQALGLILRPGESVDPAAPVGGIVSVLAGVPVSGSEDIELSDALAGGLSEQYLGVSTATAAEAASVNRILADPAAIRRHVDAIAGAAETANASGVHVDYSAVDPALRAAFTSFIEQLTARLRTTNRGIVVSVGTPPSPTDPGGYDWVPLAAVVDALWLRAPVDPAVYYEQLEPGLQAKRDSGFDLNKVALIVDRRSHERSDEGVRAISRLDALTTASVVQARLEQQGITPGRAVTVVATNLDQSAGNSGLRWDDPAKSVTFSYTSGSAQRTVWIENRLSMAFRLDMARRLGLGGVVVEAAAQDPGLPDVWNIVARHVEDGRVKLETPYGPYLRPQWSASGGQIELGASEGLAVWNAPAQMGVYEVRLVVSDGVIFVGQELSLRVAEQQREPTPVPGTATPGVTPTAIATASPTEAPTSTATAAATATATETVSPTATETASATSTAEN